VVASSWLRFACQSPDYALRLTGADNPLHCYSRRAAGIVRGATLPPFDAACLHEKSPDWLVKISRGSRCAATEEHRKRCAQDGGSRLRTYDCSHPSLKHPLEIQFDSRPPGFKVIGTFTCRNAINAARDRHPELDRPAPFRAAR
jgi:hypothetical protein